jgi:ABC-type Zn uptake system ZnuABC Zn-binding protein ZnuA
MLALAAAVSMLAAACGDSDDDSAAGKLVVVATTTQIGDMASNIGGDRIALTTLLKPNQDAHDFKPSPSQIRKLQSAGSVLRNGIGLDTYVTKAVGGNVGRVTVVTEGIALRTTEGGEEEGDADSVSEASGHDAHVWFSVANAKRMVENIRDALAQADAANTDYYRQNAIAYLASLDALDARIRQLVASAPLSCRKLVTNHDTLGYYAAAYGFEVVGSVIPSTSSEAKPSASDVADIVRKIRDEKVPAVFAETSLNPSLIRQVGREAGVRVVDDLYGDSLGPKDGEAGTYIAMMESNTRKIVEALKDCQT